MQRVADDFEKAEAGTTRVPFSLKPRDGDLLLAIAELFAVLGQVSERVRGLGLGLGRLGLSC